MNWPQALRNVRMALAMSPGAASGMTMKMSALIRPAPSSQAASSTDNGRDW